MKRSKRTVAILGSLLMLSLNAFAGDESDTTIRDALAEIAEQLELSDSVRAQIRERLESAWPYSRARLTAQAKSTARIKELLDEPEPDRDQIRRESARLSQIQADLRVNRLDSLLDILELLTSEQREQLKQLQTRRRESTYGDIPSACQADAESMCAGLELGAGLRLCLLRNRDQLTQGCIDAGIARLR